MFSQRNRDRMQAKIETAVDQLFDTELPRLKLSDKINCQLQATFANRKLATYLLNMPREELVISILDKIEIDFAENEADVLYEDLVLTLVQLKPFQVAVVPKHHRLLQQLDENFSAAVASAPRSEDYFEGGEPIITQSLDELGWRRQPQPSEASSLPKRRKSNEPVYDFAMQERPSEVIHRQKSSSPVYAELEFAQQAASYPRRTRRRSSNPYATLSFFPDPSTQRGRSTTDNYTLPQDNIDPLYDNPQPTTKPRQRRMSQRDEISTPEVARRQLPAIGTPRKLVRTGALRRKEVAQEVVQEDESLSSASNLTL